MEKDTMFCTNCGKEIKANSKFCPYCGADLSATTSAQPDSQPTPDQTTNNPATPAPDWTATYQQQTAQPQGMGGAPYNESPVPGLIASTKLYFRDILTINKRMGRADYWWAALGVALLSTVGWIILSVLLTFSTVTADEVGGETFGGIVALIAIFVLLICYVALAIASLTAEIRRFHDIGYSGAFWLLNLIPGIGGIIVLVLTCQPSRQTNNPYM